MELNELVKLLRFSEEPIMLHAANEIERLTRENTAFRAQLKAVGITPYLDRMNELAERISAMQWELDEARVEIDRLREAVEWLAHESVCGATKRFVEQFPDLAYLVWVPDGA